MVMAQGSSPSSDASIKTNASSASRVSAAKKVKFMSTSSDVCAINSSSNWVKTARANPYLAVDTEGEHSEQNSGKSPATAANNAGSSVGLLAKSVHDGNKRNNSGRNVASPTKERDVQNSTVAPTSYLTSNNNIKYNINADSKCCRTKNSVASFSSLSEIEMASTLNSSNTRSNTKSLKNKHSIISTCRKSSLSKKIITTTVNNSNNNNSTISISGLSSSNSIPSTISTRNDIATHTNIPLTNDNFCHGINNSHCSESSTDNHLASSRTMSICPSNTIDSQADSNHKQHVENGSACTNSSKRWSGGMMCWEARSLVEISKNEEMRPELGELYSQSSREAEANPEWPESAVGVDKQHKNSEPEELKKVSATHQIASNSTKSSVQCGSTSKSAVHQSIIDMTPVEAVSTLPADKGSSYSEDGPTSTHAKSSLLPHQQRQQETCLHCGTVVEFILSHLVHSRQCQSSYDLDTLEQVARRRSSGGASFLSHLSLQTLDTIPSVGASVEVANDSSFQQEENENDFIQVEADAITHDIEGREPNVYSAQSDFDLDDRVTDCDDFSEPYFLSEDNPANDGRNSQFTPMTNNNSSPWRPSSAKVKYEMPTTATSRTVARKVKELSKASVMARKVLKMPASPPDETIDLVNLVRLHSKGGVPIVMRKRKKTIQEEIEEEEIEERRRRPVITARIPINSKFYHRRSEASNSASDDDIRELCQRNHISTAESVRNKRRVPRLRDSFNLNEDPFSETVQTTQHGGETHPHLITKDKPPDVWNQDLLLMQQKLLDFQKRLKVCERLSQTSLEEGEGNGSDTRKRGSENGTLRNASSESDGFYKHDRLSGSLDAEHLEEEGSGRDFFEATEDWFIPEKLQSDRRRRGACDDARMDSKFGVKRKVVAPLHFNKELSDTTSGGLNFNNNDIGNTQPDVDEFSNSNEDVEEMPDYFDKDFLKQHFKMRSAKEQKRHSYSDPSFSPPARGGRRIHIKRTECRSCGAKIKYILSHLSKSFKCQALYDMTLLRAQSEQNKKLRQRHYERQHKSIIKERQRQYYHDKREALRNNKRFYYQQNRDNYRERQSQYYYNNYEQQRERKRLYYIQNSERIRERHRRYNTVYRQREWNKRLQLDLLHYRREMVERGEDPDASEQVVEMTQHIMALPTDIEGIKKAMVAAGTFCGDDDEEIPKGRITIDSWRRNARAWVGGRRLLEAGKEGVLAPRQHVPNARRGMARVKRLGNSKVIKLTKAGDATGVGLVDDGRGGGGSEDYDFMLAADQVIIEAVGDLELGEEIQHDVEYVADDTALVEEIYIQEERSHLAHGTDPDGRRHHSVEDVVARVGEVQTEIHEDHNHVSFIQTLMEGESFHMHDDVIDQLDDGTISVGLGVRTLKRRRRRRHNQRGSQTRRTLNAKRASFKFSYRRTNEDNPDESDTRQTTNEHDTLNETEGTNLDDCAENHFIPNNENDVTCDSAMADVMQTPSRDEVVLPPVN